jgi:hypothetical protein
LAVRRPAQGLLGADFCYSYALLSSTTVQSILIFNSVGFVQSCECGLIKQKPIPVLLAFRTAAFIYPELENPLVEKQTATKENPLERYLLLINNSQSKHLSISSNFW